MWDRGCVLVAPALGLLQKWPHPRLQELLSDHNRGSGGKRGAAGRGARESGQTGTYTTDVCSEKYSKIIMQM